MTQANRRKGKSVDAIDLPTPAPSRKQIKAMVKKNSFKGGLAPKTFNQKVLIESIIKNDVTFAVGPPGTGKTFIAATFGLIKVMSQGYDRIVIVRPAVEAGEKIGFLPGDIDSKMLPFIRPILDVISKHIKGASCEEILASGIVEVCPVAFLKGRTLDNCFLLVDEAQDLTEKQMRMVLSRQGEHCKTVVCGDLKQTDLHSKDPSGLVKAMQALCDAPGFHVVNLNQADIQRSEIVKTLMEYWGEKEEEDCSSHDIDQADFEPLTPYNVEHPYHRNGNGNGHLVDHIHHGPGEMFRASAV